MPRLGRQSQLKAFSCGFLLSADLSGGHMLTSKLPKFWKGSNIFGFQNRIGKAFRALQAEYAAKARRGCEKR
jgi:hypothetical protein